MCYCFMVLVTATFPVPEPVVQLQQLHRACSAEGNRLVRRRLLLADWCGRAPVAACQWLCCVRRAEAGVDCFQRCSARAAVGVLLVYHSRVLRSCACNARSVQLQLRCFCIPSPCFVSGICAPCA
jgi:hypothetical protein